MTIFQMFNRFKFLALVILLSLLGSNSVLRSDEKPRLVMMCLSAHPDDEDGLVLTSYARLRNVKTYSIFFTRGEGGQNEIGSQLDADLGKLRTKETSEAANILGSQIYFLGFNDFGFSKTAKETFTRWGGIDTVMARLVYVIRALKPDVIITNHDTITLSPRRQHGHHQVVGLTAFAAFTKAADSSFHPEQFRNPNIRPWQVKKLFLRARAWDTLSALVNVDPNLTDSSGNTMQSYSLSALARHHSQGMDKLIADRSPFLFTKHRYKLFESDKQYPFDSSNLFSGIEPFARQTGILPEEEIDTTAVFSFSIDPPSSVLLRADEMKRQKIQRDVTASFVNPTLSAVSFDLSVSLDHQKIFYKSYTIPTGTKTDNIRLSFLRPTQLAKKIIHFDALPTEQNSKFPVPPATFTLLPLHVQYPPTISIGLVQTYDKTVEDVLKSFKIKYQLLDSLRIAKENLNKYSTIILDLRTYEFRHDVAWYNARLLKYVQDGGNIVCFYHKSFDWNGYNYSPYPIQLTTERVTEEGAHVNVLVPGHPFFNSPNIISKTDWDGWVQERNLYLPADDSTKTSPKYSRLLAMSDENENQPPTSLLWCKNGKGTYTYVALALYRQLRNMHEGALKLFFNLISQPKHPF
jgi:LmbE family N-acetylglucosaminyl deacetylase